MNESIESSDFPESTKLKEISGFKLTIFYSLSSGILIPLLFFLAGLFFIFIVSFLSADSKSNDALVLLPGRSRILLLFVVQISFLFSVKFAYLTLKYNYTVSEPRKYIRSTSIIYIVLLVLINVALILFYKDIKFENIWGMIIFSVICIFNFNIWTQAYFTEWKSIYDEKNDPEYIDKQRFYPLPLVGFVILFILSALIVFPIIMMLLTNHFPKIILSWTNHSEMNLAGAYIIGAFVGSSFIKSIFQKKFTYPYPKTAEVYILVVSNTLILLALAISLTVISKPDYILYITSALISIIVITVTVKIGFPLVSSAAKSVQLAHPVMTSEPQLSIDRNEEHLNFDETD